MTAIIIQNYHSEFKTNHSLYLELLTHPVVTTRIGHWMSMKSWGLSAAALAVQLVQTRLRITRWFFFFSASSLTSASLSDFGGVVFSFWSAKGIHALSRPCTLRQSSHVVVGLAAAQQLMAWTRLLDGSILAA